MWGNSVLRSRASRSRTLLPHGSIICLSRDCWVIGYDDVEMAALDSFSLTTVRQPSREMARVGAKMLIDRLSSPESAPRRVNFPCDLIVRGSTERA